MSLKGFRYAAGRAIRETGNALERVGLRAEDNLGFETFVNRIPIYKHFGKTPQISKDAFVAPNAAIIGNVRLFPNSSIWYGAVLRGDSNNIFVGNGSSIGDNSVVHVSSKNSLREIPNPTIIGQRVVVEPGCIIHACTLQDNCTVGTGSVIADGSVIGEHSVIEPGSFVSQDTQVPERQVWGGKPARYIRSLSDEEVNENTPVPESIQQLAQKHRNIQEELQVQPGDYDDKTYYPKE